MAGFDVVMRCAHSYLFIYIMLVFSVNLTDSNKFFLAAALWTTQYDGD